MGKEQVAMGGGIDSGGGSGSSGNEDDGEVWHHVLLE